MAGRITAKLTGAKALQRGLDRLNPETNRRIMEPALTESMLLTLRIAARDKIFSGGGGPPKPKILTSRTGRLRGSLAGSRSLDKSGLSRNFIEGGSDVVYAAVHEFGSSRMPKRPYLAPALADAEAKFPDIIIKHWEKQLR